MNAQAARAKHLVDQRAHIPGGKDSGKLKKHFGNEHGLAIQPFIFAIESCVPDIAAQISRNETRAGYSTGPNPDRIHWARLEYSLDRWRDHKDLQTVQMIAHSAEKCVPLLNQHYQYLARHRPDDLPNFSMQLRGIDDALNELGSLTSDAEVKRPKPRFIPRTQVVESPEHMCALA